MTRRRTLTTIATLAAACLAVAPSHAGGAFTSTSPVPLGGYVTPVAVALGDVSGDGRLDLMVVSRGTNSMVLRIGNGNGTFGLAQGYGLSGYTAPSSLVAADFNRDGRTDVATAFESPPVISVSLGLATTPNLQFNDNPTPPAKPLSLAAADMNADGKLDLIAGLANGTIAVFPGTGFASFGPPIVTSLGSPGGSVVAVAAGDVNGDGRADVVAATDGHRVVKLLGAGGNTFASPTQSYFGDPTSPPRALTLADLDGDGALDLAVTVGTHVAVMRVSAPGFAAIQTIATPEATGVAAQDLDNDGAMDLAVTNRTQTSVTTLVQRNGALGRIRSHITHLTQGLEPVAVAVGDVDSDGAADIATANKASNNVSILQSRALLSAPMSLDVGGQDLGTQGDERTVALRSDGFALLKLGTVSLSGPDASAFDVQHACDGRNLSFDAACDVSVRFSPSRLGSHSATLTVTHSGLGGTRSIPLSGEGIDSIPPTVTIDAQDGDVMISPLEMLEGTASDAQTAIASDAGAVVVRFTDVLGQTTDPAVSLACNASRSACDWSAPLPLVPGPYTAAVTARDVHGNVSPPVEVDLFVV